MLVGMFPGYSQDTGASVVLKGKDFEVSFPNSKKILWQYQETKTGKSLDFAAPSFEIDDKIMDCELLNIQKIGEPVKLNIGVTEYVVQGAFRQMPDLFLRITFRVPDLNPVVRFRYELIGSGNHKLIKSAGADNIHYLSVSVPGVSKIKEVKLSEFNEMVHSFCLSEREMDVRNFNNQTSFMGPIVTGSDSGHSFLLAYEHGSQAPDVFLEYTLSAEKTITLNAVKGNYASGLPVTKENPYQSVWLEAALIQGNEDLLAENYRQFILRNMSPNAESRKPYIFYNTWNFQERNKHWYKKTYLADMTMERMLQEIEVAHKMGIEVFVVDAGWFEKTGDWQPSKTRFPDELKTVKAKLDAYGMKLGLWFNPTVAAKSSSMLAKNKDCMQTHNGKTGKPFPIWETEESYGMCLVSPYRDAFADELIRLAKEVGVRYFKWDAIGQYGCNEIIRDGAVGGSPEVYEKINKENGKGAVVVFSSHRGSYEYVSRSKPSQKYWSTKGVELKFDNEGYAVIKVSFEKAEAKIVYFGVDQK